MDLISFARAHGIIMDRMPEIGVWRRFKTVDHPKKRNGAVKFMGTHAFVQNHATDTKVSVWKPDSAQADEREFRRMIEQSERVKREAQARAAAKAKQIIKECVISGHPYLEKKGFKDDYGLTYRTDGKLLLVVPMWVGSEVVGCQLIDEQGEKRFLFGQRTAGAAHIIDSKGPTILCEGYATGLSVQAALKKLNRPYRIFVCFSAGNMLKVSRSVPEGLVIADNDRSGTGQRIAREIGWTYWLSDIEGEDANDAHKRLGLFRFSQSLYGGKNLNVPAPDGLHARG